MTTGGNVTLSKDNAGISGIMGGGTDNWGIQGSGSGDSGRLKIYVGDNGTTDWLDFEFRDYTGTTYTPLSMTGNQIAFNYNPTVSGNAIIHAGNISSQNVSYANSAGSVAWGNVSGKPFNWSGQSGQPSWLWGSNDGSNYYVWNPSNFSVNYANSAGSVAWSNVSGRPTNLNQFTNGPGYITSSGSCASATNTSFSAQFSISHAGNIDTGISINVSSGRCMLVLYTCHGDSGSACGSRLYMIRCGVNSNYITSTCFCSSTPNDSLYYASFSNYNGTLRIYNNFANASFLILFTNWV